VTKERCDSHIAVGVPGFLKEDMGRAFELPALDTSMRGVGTNCHLHK